jgi:hypothetical protein
VSSFQHAARKVRDPERSPWLRLSALRGCVSSFCWLTGQPFRATLVRFGISPEQVTTPPGEEFLLATLARVEAERDRYHAARQPFDAARREIKRKGGRQLSNAERETLRRMSEVTPLDAEAGG